MNSGSFQLTSIMPVPFINLSASNPTTLYSALNFAANQCKTNNQPCIVTFDQPLYIKSWKICASSDDTNLKSFVVRLGGFHLLMSFLGSIGNILVCFESFIFKLTYIAHSIL